MEIIGNSIHLLGLMLPLFFFCEKVINPHTH